MDYNEYLIQALICGWLLLCSYQDLRSKQINMLLIIAGFILVIIAAMLYRDISIIQRIVGISPGIILLLLNHITRGQIGAGDGLITGILGINLGLMQNIVLLSYGLFGSSVVSIILLSFGLVNRKKAIPFVPFIFMGYLGVICFA